MTALPSLDPVWNPPALDNPEGVRRWLEWLQEVRSAYPDHPGIQEQVAVCERLGRQYLQRAEAEGDGE